MFVYMRKKMNKKPIIPPGFNVKYDVWHFSPAIESGEFVFVSGCTGNRPDGTISQVATEQFEQTFLTIEKTLAAAHLTLDDIVEMTTYHVGLKKQLKSFMNVKDKYINKPYPAWTAIGISELAVDDAIIEIKVTAKSHNK